MKLLNYDKVLCLSPHPDDVEYGMLGTICKYKNTQFDIVFLSQGGDFDQSTAKERQGVQVAGPGFGKGAYFAEGGLATMFRNKR